MADFHPTNGWLRSRGLWRGPDTTKIWREWRAKQAAARAATPPPAADPADALPSDPIQLRQMVLAAHQRITELESQLNAMVPPHQRNVERREV